MDQQNQTSSSKYHLSPIDLSNHPSSSRSLSNNMSPALLHGLAGDLPKPSPKTPSLPDYHHNLSVQEAAYSMGAYDYDSNPDSANGQRQCFSDFPQRKLTTYLPPHRRVDGGGVQLFSQNNVAPPAQPMTPVSGNAMGMSAFERFENSQRALAGTQVALNQGFAELQQTQVALAQTFNLLAQRFAVNQQTMNNHLQDINAISDSLNNINMGISTIGQSMHAIDQTIQNVEQNVNAIKETENKNSSLTNQSIRNNEIDTRLARLEGFLATSDTPSVLARSNRQSSMQLSNRRPPPGLHRNTQPSASAPAQQPAPVVNNTYHIHGSNSKVIGNAVAGSSGSLASPNPYDDVFGPNPRAWSPSADDRRHTLRVTRDDPAQFAAHIRKYHGTPRDTPGQVIRTSSDDTGAPWTSNGKQPQPQLVLPFHSPNSLDEVEVKKSVGDIFTSITTKIEQFVHRFLLSKDLQPSSQWKDKSGDRLFQECRDHVGHVGQTKKLLLSLDSKTLLFTGVLMRMLHKYVLGGSMLDGFNMTKTAQEFAAAWLKEKDATGPVTAMDYAFRDDLAKHRSKLANEIVYRTPGFHKWLQVKSIKRAEEFMSVLACIVLNQNIDVATKEMKHIMQETYRLAARIRCERNFFCYEWANATFAFNHQTMVHRNQEFIGRTLDELPSKYVVLCTVAPLFVEKIFANNTMEKITHHKIEVYLGDRHGNLR